MSAAIHDSARIKGVVVDAAGAFRGGAARLLRELDQLSEQRMFSPPQVIGRGKNLSPAWLATRNRHARPGKRSVALNNVPLFWGDPRVVLVRNILHFATPEDFETLHYTPGREFRLQITVVRRLLPVADVVVCPCSAMAERVAHFVPSVRDRVVVRFHPVTPVDRPALARADVSEDPFILVPIVNSPYKNLDLHLNVLLSALDAALLPHRVVVTGSANEYGDRVANDPRMRFLGVIDSATLDSYWGASRLAYFPMTMEAFGYPVAEARANGVPILAADTAQNREIGGSSLVPFLPGDSKSLADALTQGVTCDLPPEPSLFDPRQYFTWLLGRV